MSQADYDRIGEIIAEIKRAQYEHERGGREPRDDYEEDVRDRARQQRLSRTYRDAQ